MDKILLEIACPGTSKRYDFWVSKKMNVGSVKTKLMAEISDYEKNYLLFREEGKVMLFRENGEVLPEGRKTMEQVGIHSGDCLMLV